MTSPRRTPAFGLVGSVFVSQAGTAMSAVAIPWLVLVLTGSAGRTGLTGFVELAPYVVVQATAGPLADRYGCRRVCIAGNLVAALAVCAIPVLSTAGLLTFPMLLVAVAVGGAARGVADAGTGPLVPATAALAALSNERVAGLYSAASRAALLVGMPAAGALIGLISPATVVLIDGISFAVAAVGIALTVPASAARQPDNPQPDQPRDTGLRAYAASLAEGLRFLRGDRLLLGFAALAAVSNLLDQAFMVVLVPVWARTEVHSANGVGLIGGGFAIGSLLGVLVGAWLGERMPRYLSFAWGYLLGGAPPFFAVALWTTVVPPVVVAAVAGAVSGSLNPIISAVSYERIPAPLQARVLAAIKASAWVGLPLGSLVGGVFEELAGLRPALVACGVIMLLATAAPLVRPAVWRTMDRRPGVVAVPG